MLEPTKRSIKAQNSKLEDHSEHRFLMVLAGCGGFQEAQTTLRIAVESECLLLPSEAPIQLWLTLAAIESLIEYVFEVIY